MARRRTQEAQRLGPSPKFCILLASPGLSGEMKSASYLCLQPVCVDREVRSQSHHLNESAGPSLMTLLTTALDINGRWSQCLCAHDIPCAGPVFLIWVCGSSFAPPVMTQTTTNFCRHRYRRIALGSLQSPTPPMRTSSRRRVGHIVLRAQKRHQSGAREPPTGQIIIRVRTTNKSAILFLFAAEVSTTPTLHVKGNPSHP